MFLKRHANLIVILLLLWMCVVSLAVSSQESTTMDEKAHIPSAYTYVKYGDMRLNPEHPPLLKDLAGLPLLALDPEPVFPTDSWLWTDGINEQWTLGDLLLHGNGNDAETITYWSRFPIILITLLLGFFIFVWTKEIAGTLAGLLALTFYAFDPNILGHGHYVTTDIGIAAFVFMAAYYFVRFLKQPTWERVFWMGIFLGLAQLAKFSAVLLFPLFGLFVLGYPLLKRMTADERRGRAAPRWSLIWEYVSKFAVGVFICFVLIWIVYIPNTVNMPVEKLNAVAEVMFPDRGLGPLAKSVIAAMSEYPFLKGMTEYFLGVFMVFARVAGGNTYYFLGTVSNQASSLYFPLVFVLKETLPFLFLMCVGLLFTLRRAWSEVRERHYSVREHLARFVENKIAQLVMLAFVALYSYLSITGNLNIGFRHLFPILPFLYLLTASGIVALVRRLHDRHAHWRLLSSGVLGAFIFWIIMIPVLAYPSYLSYFNEAAGGPEHGYRYVTDSNYDWGQDLKRLRQWVDRYNVCVGTSPQPAECATLTEGGQPLPTETPIEKIRIDYFGGSSPAYYFGDMFVPWHGENAPEPGWYGISVGFFQESIHKEKPADQWSYTWLAKYPRLARAGDSIFIFYVPETAPAVAPEE